MTGTINCEFCGGKFERTLAWGIRYKQHRKVCRNASPEDRAFWIIQRKWPWRVDARMAHFVWLSTRSAEWMRQGLCKGCGADPGVNPVTGKPYKNCEEHRAYYRVYQQTKREPLPRKRKKRVRTSAVAAMKELRIERSKRVSETEAEIESMLAGRTRRRAA